MKLAIATPKQAGIEWTPFLTEFMTPAEIRLKLAGWIQTERDSGDAGDDTEFKIVTMNRTVLDQVTSEHAKNVGPITYENVLVWKEDHGRLVPLLALHDDCWLCHFSLGDVFDRGLL